MAWVPPAKRRLTESKTLDEHHKNEAVSHRIRGLLNRVSEENIQSMVAKMVSLINEFGRVLVSTEISKEILKAVSSGPKATEQFVGIAAATISAVCALTQSHEMTANFLHNIAKQFEASFLQNDSIGTMNLLMLLCHLYLIGLVAFKLMYSLLDQFVERFQDLDVTGIFRLLETCGLRMRSDDPEAMKCFIINVHRRAGDFSKQGILSKKAELMLDLVIDIKNNRLAKKGSRESFIHLSHTVGKWLQKIDVSKIALMDLNWKKLLDSQKTGQWWLPENREDTDRTVSMTGIGKEGLGTELLDLAAQQQMNTEARKTVFCIIMGADDVVSACERLLALPFRGEQDRDVMVVLLDCCFQERRWNPYYANLASQLCLMKKSHRITLQRLLSKKLDVLDDLNVRTLDRLSKMMSFLIHAEALSFRIFKDVGLSPANEKTVFFWRIFLLHLLASFDTIDHLLEAFTKVVTSPTLFEFGRNVLLFLRFHFVPWIGKLDSNHTNWVSENQIDSLKMRQKRLQSLLKTIPM